MPMRPLISCIVPVYNGAAYLAAAIDSILAQDYRPLDVIVVDDGSTDESAAIAARYGEPVRVLAIDHVGMDDARNAGLEAAKGGYIAFLDADDLWHSQKLSLQMDVFERSPDVEICYAYAQNFWEPIVADEARQLDDWLLAKPVPARAITTALIRRDVFDRQGRFGGKTGLWNDKAWTIRADDDGVVTHVCDSILLYRRIHATNQTRARNRIDRDNMLAVVKEALDRRRSRGSSAA